MLLRSKLTAWGLVALVVVAAAFELRADSPADGVPGGGFGKWRETPLGRLISGHLGRALVLRSEMEVSAEQREKIHAIMKSHRQEAAQAIRPVVEQRRKLRELVTAEKPDEAAIRAAGDALGKAIGDAAVKLSQIAGELRGVLTPEQIEKLEKFHDANEGAVDKFFDKLVSE